MDILKRFKFFKFQGFAEAFALDSPPIFTGSRAHHPRPRHLPQNFDETSDFGLDENELQGVELLDVRHPESPYGLIQEVLPTQSGRRPAAASSNFRPFATNDLGGLRPSEVFLADGDLLILKGGTASDEIGGGNVWPPIDNYEGMTKHLVLGQTL